MIMLLVLGFSTTEGLANNSFFGTIESARILHDRGVNGDKQAVIDCITQLQELLANEPENYLAKVYLGSAYTLRSRDVFPGPKKLNLLNEGGRLMDEAVAAAPDNIRVRLVRAVNYYKLPAIFGKRELARSELIKLAESIDGMQHDLDLIEIQGIYYFGGLALADQKRRAAARQLWAEAIELQPDSTLGEKLSQKLKQ